MEKRTGSLMFALLFFGFGILANLGYLYMNPAYLSHICSIGSSASIAGIMGFVLMTDPSAMAVFFTVIPPHRLKFPAFFFLVIWFVSQIAYGFESYGRVEQDTASVNYWVHIYGFISGLLAGLIYRTYVMSRERFKELKEEKSLSKIVQKYSSQNPVNVAAELDAWLKQKSEISGGISLFLHCVFEYPALNCN